MKVLPVHQAREKQRVMAKSKGENRLTPTEEMHLKKSLILIDQTTYIKRIQLQTWHPTQQHKRRIDQMRYQLSLLKASVNSLLEIKDFKLRPTFQRTMFTTKARSSAYVHMNLLTIQSTFNKTSPTSAMSLSSTPTTTPTVQTNNSPCTKCNLLAELVNL